MKADDCKICKGKGRFVQPLASIKGPKSRSTTCYHIVEHFIEARGLLEEVHEIYKRTVALGRERQFIREVYNLLAKNGFTEVTGGEQ